MWQLPLHFHHTRFHSVAEWFLHTGLISSWIENRPGGIWAARFSVCNYPRNFAGKLAGPERSRSGRETRAVRCSSSRKRDCTEEFAGLSGFARIFRKLFPRAVCPFQLAAFLSKQIFSQLQSSRRFIIFYCTNKLSFIDINVKFKLLKFEIFN